MIETKFNLRTYIFPLLTIGFPVLLCIALSDGGFSKDLPIFIVLAISSLVIFSFLLLLLGELRNRAIYLKIDSDRVFVKRYMGLGSTQEVKLKDIDGYTLSELSYAHLDYECISLLTIGKKTIRISKFHHKNYRELKEVIEKKIKFNGRIHVGFFSEFRDIWK